MIRNSNSLASEQEYEDSPGYDELVGIVGGAPAPVAAAPVAAPPPPIAAPEPAPAPAPAPALAPKSLLPANFDWTKGSQIIDGITYTRGMEGQVPGEGGAMEGGYFNNQIFRNTPGQNTYEELDLTGQVVARHVGEKDRGFFGDFFSDLGSVITDTPILQMASIIPSPLQPFAAAANAIINKDPLAAIAAAAGAGGFTDVANAAKVASAIDRGDLLGAVTPGLSLAGVSDIGGFSAKDISSAARVASAIDRGDLLSAVMPALGIAGLTDVGGVSTQDIGKGIGALRAIESGNPLALLNVASSYLPGPAMPGTTGNEITEGFFAPGGEGFMPTASETAVGGGAENSGFFDAEEAQAVRDDIASLLARYPDAEPSFFPEFDAPLLTQEPVYEQPPTPEPEPIYEQPPTPATEPTVSAQGIASLFPEFDAPLLTQEPVNQEVSSSIRTVAPVTQIDPLKELMLQTGLTPDNEGFYLADLDVPTATLASTPVSTPISAPERNAFLEANIEAPATVEQLMQKYFPELYQAPTAQRIEVTSKLPDQTFYELPEAPSMQDLYQPPGVIEGPSTIEVTGKREPIYEQPPTPALDEPRYVNVTEGKPETIEITGKKYEPIYEQPPTPEPEPIYEQPPTPEPEPIYEQPPTPEPEPIYEQPPTPAPTPAPAPGPSAAPGKAPAPSPAPRPSVAPTPRSSEAQLTRYDPVLAQVDPYDLDRLFSIGRQGGMTIEDLLKIISGETTRRRS